MKSQENTERKELRENVSLLTQKLQLSNSTGTDYRGNDPLLRVNLQ